MSQLSDITTVIGFAAANHSGEMVALLSRNGVVVPTETLTTKMLVALIVNALAESPSFAKDLTAWAASKEGSFANNTGTGTFIGPLLPDGSTTSGGGSEKGGGFNWGKAFDNFLKIGTTAANYIQGRQQIAAADSLAAAEAAKLEAARIQSEAEEKSFGSKLALSQASTTKVVVFGLLGLALVGGAIWYFTRKK